MGQRYGHDMHVELQRPSDEAILVVRIQGVLDRFSAPRLKEMLVGAVEGGTNELIIDLSDVTSVDSSGLGALVGMLRRAERVGGGLRLTGANEKLADILIRMSLDDLFQQDKTVQDAITHFRSSGQASS
jgi:anti-sigma B factor antagonist